MTQLSPQPGLDINPGGTTSFTDSTLYDAMNLRVRDVGNYGWWPVVWSTDGAKTVLGLEGASEIGSLKIFDTSSFTYDGGIINGRVELYMNALLIIFTSGGSDWTLDGSPISGYFPTNLALDMLPGQEYVLAGTMETPGVSRSLRIQNYSQDSRVWMSPL